MPITTALCGTQSGERTADLALISERVALIMDDACSSCPPTRRCAPRQMKRAGGDHFQTTLTVTEVFTLAWRLPTLGSRQNTALK